MLCLYVKLLDSRLKQFCTEFWPTWMTSGTLKKSRQKKKKKIQPCEIWTVIYTGPSYKPQDSRASVLPRPRLLEASGVSNPSDVSPPQSTFPKWPPTEWHFPNNSLQINNAVVLYLWETCQCQSSPKLCEKCHFYPRKGDFQGKTSLHVPVPMPRQFSENQQGRAGQVDLPDALRRLQWVRGREPASGVVLENYQVNGHGRLPAKWTWERLTLVSGPHRDTSKIVPRK